MGQWKMVAMTPIKSSDKHKCKYLLETVEKGVSGVVDFNQIESETRTNEKREGDREVGALRFFIMIRGFNFLFGSFVQR